VLWVLVFTNNGDFDAYRPRWPATTAAWTTTPPSPHRTGYASCTPLDGVRPAWLIWGVKKVTRVLAERHLELRPLVALFSECHELFNHPLYGREVADLAVQTLRRGGRRRSRWRSTPNPHERMRSHPASSSW
jgi:DNA segregation ATPase FtsK/SpoIIIE, S-DNA-T family